MLRDTPIKVLIKIQLRKSHVNIIIFWVSPKSKMILYRKAKLIT